GSHLAISATGGVSRSPSFPLVSPDGEAVVTAHDGGSANGIANVSPTGFSALMGVFLDNNQPDLSGAPFPAADNANPGLKQVFRIGSSANVTVPPGATRLFLGVMDSFEWQNNQGQFTVQIGSSPCLLYDPAKAAKSGSTIPIKLEL